MNGAGNAFPGLARATQWVSVIWKSHRKSYTFEKRHKYWGHFGQSSERSLKTITLPPSFSKFYEGGRFLLTLQKAVLYSCDKCLHGVVACSLLFVRRSGSLLNILIANMLAISRCLVAEERVFSLSRIWFFPNDSGWVNGERVAIKEVSKSTEYCTQNSVTTTFHGRWARPSSRRNVCYSSSPCFPTSNLGGAGYEFDTKAAYSCWLSPDNCR